MKDIWAMHKIGEQWTLHKTQQAQRPKRLQSVPSDHRDGAQSFNTVTVTQYFTSNSCIFPPEENWT